MPQADPVQRGGLLPGVARHPPDITSLRLRPTLREPAVPLVAMSPTVVREIRPVGAAWRADILRYPWPASEVERVIGCESGGNPGAENGTNIGLLQINWPYHLDQLAAVTGKRDWQLLFDPAVNLAVAYLIWRDEGGNWSAWACRP